MNRMPRPQEIYKHFKGNLYQIITLAEDSETGEELVIYQALYGEFKVYARPLEIFISEVDRAKYPEAAQEYRFELQQVGGVVPEEKSEVRAIREEKSTVSSMQEEEPTLDPLVWEFLDADSHEKRLNILAALHHRITDDMITVMAVACDVEVPDGDVEERYTQLKNCLLMLDKFEIKRK